MIDEKLDIELCGIYLLSHYLYKLEAKMINFVANFFFLYLEVSSWEAPLYLTCRLTCKNFITSDSL